VTTALMGYYEGDELRLNYIASAAPSQLDARVYYLTPARPDGPPFVDSVPALTSFTADRTPQFIEADVGAGGSCNIVGGGVSLPSPLETVIKRGQFYVRFVIRRQNSGFEDCLCCGYIYSARPFLSIGEHIEPGPGGGEGFIRTVTGTDPGSSGEEIVETVPTNAFWRLISFGAVFVTSSDAATRTPNLAIDDGTTANRSHIWQGSTQAASLTRTHLFQQEYGGSGAQGAGNASIVDTDTILTREVLPNNLFLKEGHRIRTVTLNIDTVAALFDNWAAPIYQVEEWLKV